MLKSPVSLPPVLDSLVTRLTGKAEAIETESRDESQGRILLDVPAHDYTREERAQMDELKSFRASLYPVGEEA